MTNYLPMDHHRDGGPVDGQHGRLRSQRPTKIYVIRAGYCSALSRSIDAAKWFRRKRVIDRDRFGSQVDLISSFVVCDGMNLVSAISSRAGSAGIRQEVGEHLVAPTGPVIKWLE